MIPSPQPTANRRTNQALIAGLLLAAVMAPGSCLGQEENNSPLTPKFLIGDAVSLSNKEYPEIDKAIQRFRNRDVAGALEYLEKAKEKSVSYTHLTLPTTPYV